VTRRGFCLFLLQGAERVEQSEWEEIGMGVDRINSMGYAGLW
jgi:hypothetical protein